MVDERAGVSPASSSRWVARLTPGESSTIEALLGMPLGLDVWQRQKDMLLVAASEGQLREIERRRLARVERLCTVAEYQERAQQRAKATETGEADESGGGDDGADHPSDLA